MKKLAIYGKGGIGKSTTTSNLAAAFAEAGKRVIQIGCDPKADSTMNLLGGKPLMPVMDYYREYTEAPDFEHIGAYGFGHVFCMETGGPTPGLGCAGRGIIATFDLIDELEVFEKINPEIVLYDVLGDVVCGGFRLLFVTDMPKKFVLLHREKKCPFMPPIIFIGLYRTSKTAAMQA